MTARSLRWIAVLALGSWPGAAMSCYTGPRSIETPTGPVLGDVFGAMEIIGLSSKYTMTGSMPNAATVWRETKLIDVPVGTEFIVPAMRGLNIGYGMYAGLTNLNIDDHHYGDSYVDVQVIDINAPDMTVTPPKQTAEIQVELFLSDGDGLEPWFGEVRYTLIFLRRRPNG